MIDKATLKIFVIVGIFILLIIFNFIITRLTHYECPECDTHFQVKGADLFKPHFMGERQEICPNCGHKGMMRRYSGKD